MTEPAAERATRHDPAEPLARAHSIVIFANGDTPQALAVALSDLALAIAAGKETRPHGADMLDDSDLRFEYRRDPAMTRDRFFAALERRVIEQTSDRRRR